MQAAQDNQYTGVFAALLNMPYASIPQPPQTPCDPVRTVAVPQFASEEARLAYAKDLDEAVAISTFIEEIDSTPPQKLDVVSGLHIRNGPAQPTNSIRACVIPMFCLSPDASIVVHTAGRDVWFVEYTSITLQILALNDSATECVWVDVNVNGRDLFTNCTTSTGCCAFAKDNSMVLHNGAWKATSMSVRFGLAGVGRSGEIGRTAQFGPVYRLVVRHVTRHHRQMSRKPMYFVFGVYPHGLIDDYRWGYGDVVNTIINRPIQLTDILNHQDSTASERQFTHRILNEIAAYPRPKKQTTQ
jgi:hypothetical protein